MQKRDIRAGGLGKLENSTKNRQEIEKKGMTSAIGKKTEKKRQKQRPGKNSFYFLPKEVILEIGLIPIKKN